MARLTARLKLLKRNRFAARSALYVLFVFALARSRIFEIEFKFFAALLFYKKSFSPIADIAALAKAPIAPPEHA